MKVLGKWKDLDVVWKWRALFGSAALLLLITYKYSVRKTITMIHAYNTLCQSIDTLKTAGGLNDVMPAANRSRGTDGEVPAGVSLLDYITTISVEKNISIRQVAQSLHTGSDSAGYVIQTNKLVIEGSYAGMLDLIYSIEKTKRIASVSAAKIELNKDRATGRYRLLGTLYVKNMRYGQPQ